MGAAPGAHAVRRRPGAERRRWSSPAAIRRVSRSRRPPRWPPSAPRRARARRGAVRRRRPQLAPPAPARRATCRRTRRRGWSGCATSSRKPLSVSWLCARLRRDGETLFRRGRSRRRLRRTVCRRASRDDAARAAAALSSGGSTPTGGSRRPTPRWPSASAPSRRKTGRRSTRLSARARPRRRMARARRRRARLSAACRCSGRSRRASVAARVLALRRAAFAAGQTYRGFRGFGV